MGYQQDMLGNLGIDPGMMYGGGGYEEYPMDGMYPMNQNFDYDTGDRAARLKEARLMEALEKQTALLDSISQSYQRNKEMRQKAELRKLKNRLEGLENKKLFRELELQQVQAANDIAQQNNQIIFSHLSTIILTISPCLTFYNRCPSST